MSDARGVGRTALRVAVIAFVLAVAAAAVIIGGRHDARLAEGEASGNVSELASMCESAPRIEGFGVASVNGPLSYVNSSATIPVPCKLEMQQGGSLSLTNVELQTQSLVIMDADSNGFTSVAISGSRLVGTEGTGLLVQLVDPLDVFSLERTSLVSYPAEVSVTVGGVAPPEGGKLAVSSATIESLAPDSAGITFAASTNLGTATFFDVVLRTANDDVTKFLAGGTCNAVNVQALSASRSSELGGPSSRSYPRSPGER